MKLASVLVPVAWCLILACDSSITNHEAKSIQDSLQGHLTSDLVQNPHSLASSSSKQVAPAQISFTDTLHQFGRIQEGEIVNYEFEFTNTGEADLLINDTKTSCGCTTPEYPRQPIRAGEKEVIRVIFNSTGKRGYNEKSIVVFSNAQPATQELLIQAEVR
ncbi:MAG: DUF1573 domain-containing protein [Bacteroidota bacterium]|nr:MAG: DUF1573 domain-containing protein [Bacteroidota bacterium]